MQYFRSRESRLMIWQHQICKAMRESSTQIYPLAVAKRFRQVSTGKSIYASFSTKSSTNPPICLMTGVKGVQGTHAGDKDSCDGCHGVSAVDQLCLLVPAPTPTIVSEPKLHCLSHIKGQISIIPHSNTCPTSKTESPQRLLAFA